MDLYDTWLSENRYFSLSLSLFGMKNLNLKKKKKTYALEQNERGGTNQFFSLLR